MKRDNSIWKKRNNILLFAFLFLFSAFLVQGKCPEKSGPVDILPGDMCSFCAMHITEKKYSAQYRTSDRKVKKFDDIGCLVLSYIKEKDKVREIWFVDFQTGKWIDVDNALFSSGFTTPMHFGFVAFEKQNCKGDCINFQQLIKKIEQIYEE